MMVNNGFDKLPLIYIYMLLLNHTYLLLRCGLINSKLFYKKYPIAFTLFALFQVIYCGPSGSQRFHSNHQPLPTKSTRSGSLGPTDVA